jgi:hypothetical protein
MSYCACGTYVCSPSEPHVLYSSRLSFHSFVVSFFVDDISAIRAVLCPEPPLTMTKDVLSVCLERVTCPLSGIQRIVLFGERQGYM